MKTKKCNKCKEVKIINKFSKRSHSIDKLQSQCKEYYRKYYQKYKIKYKRYYKKYRNKALKYMKNYRQTYSKELNRYRREHMKININYRLSSYLRTRIYQTLKNINKSNSTRKLVGCSIEFLKQYLEQQFTKGMNWENYGKWHVDHIKLCCQFDLSKVSEQKECFNYTNLRPLWAKDNLSRSKK